MTQYTLEEIKSHSNFPFADFGSDPLSFLMLELYWSQLFAETMGKNGVGWSSLTEAQMDGNPIFSVTSLSLLRKLRIIHKVNEGNLPAYPASKGEGTHYPLQAWLNNSYTTDGNTALNELVLAADLSSEAEREALKLITLHCIDLADTTTVDNAICDYEDRVGMPD